VEVLTERRTRRASECHAPPRTIRQVPSSEPGGRWPHQGRTNRTSPGTTPTRCPACRKGPKGSGPSSPPGGCRPGARWHS